MGENFTSGMEEKCNFEQSSQEPISSAYVKKMAQLEAKISVEN
jgi:hypothetical protein